MRTRLGIACSIARLIEKVCFQTPKGGLRATVLLNLDVTQLPHPPHRRISPLSLCAGKGDGG